MAKTDRKTCAQALAVIQRAFPAEKPAFVECSYCPLLKADKHDLHCGFLGGSPGRFVNVRVPSQIKRRVVILKTDFSARGMVLPAGEELLLDRNQNAGVYLWVTPRNRGFGRFGKFLINRALLDMDGPLVRTAHGSTVEEISEIAVLIAGIWWPRCEIRKPTDLRKGDQVNFIEVPEWLALLKGLC